MTGLVMQRIFCYDRFTITEFMNLVGSKTIISALAALLLVSACSTTPLEDRFSCANSDWYEIGRRDGASGAPLARWAHYHERCGDRIDPQSEDMYRNGRNSGLVEYCTPNNAFELGRMHIAYNSVCPSQMESAFTEAYEKGTHARELDLETKRVSQRIEQLSQQLTEQRTIASDQKAKLSGELEVLKQQRAELEQQINKIAR